MKKVKYFIANFGKMREYQFAVRREVTGNGHEIFTPVVKRPGLFSRWERIVQIYNKYYTMELPDEDHNLTLGQCHDHIVQFKAQLYSELLQVKKSDIQYLKASIGFNIEDVDKW